MSDNESLIAGLKYELSGARQLGDKDHEKAVLAELKRVGAPESEKAVAKKSTETRQKD